MQGKIVKGIAGFYYVHTKNHGVYECKAKGIFRNQKIKPLVGDDVEIDVIDKEKKVGNLVGIIKRSSELIRPAVANVDQALVIFAASQPVPNLNLLDRFLVMMFKQGIKTIVCFNKKDIVSEDEMELLRNAYQKCGYQVLFISALQEQGVEEIRELIRCKTTVLAGPSGVGKSSIMNLIQPAAQMETGSVSRKIERGKHTTRHSELFYVEEDTYVMDTPGFSSLYLEDVEKEELKNCFVEFDEYEEMCRFQGCVHINEPNCAVKDALESGKISRLRYESYVMIYEELKDKKKYK